MSVSTLEASPFHGAKRHRPVMLLWCLFVRPRSCSNALPREQQAATSGFTARIPVGVCRFRFRNTKTKPKK
uniref:Putative secreted protein n=1 Tax=Anopheles darlingi TaxID=43151 RepID=A0A2M4DCJ5_ANODA